MHGNRTKYGLRAKNRGLIFQGLYKSYRHALEDAYRKRVDLTGLDAAHQDLRGLTLDGIAVNGARFTGANLMDANLSEGAFKNCVFDRAALFDTCLCYSDFTSCSFLDSRFGMTDLSEASLRDCHFAGTSSFGLNFHRARSLRNNAYRHQDRVLNFSLPPVLVQGPRLSMLILDDHVLANGQIVECAQDKISRTG